ncbi:MULTISPECIES: hypothetical protein [Prevotella]|jgi:hypothetical protein|uniref:Uncharacterized protein n=1 Tax=Prevotella jejuni TaxID=1177574 RepID=A0A2N9QSB1_9BACT|nr:MULTISPECIES: hypothetical protein [Prevotella]MBF1571203.1 hypothetical protein [Prevotella sp.]AUI56594.1 hypothetical protein CRM71_15330 [Prevotella jejuni]EGW48575.1 hypothetical protein HMPREF0666_00288 [Prevotella sp. C561]PTL30187.1 hypothetical protein AXF23_03170 [Prevotella sp. oral taxon 313]QUB78970.1 hypothetical protein J4857_12095 [Prevotella jejuni]
MAIYDYGIGGNEVNVDANESIADIPSNRTLLVQKLTDEAPVSPETVYGLQTVEDVFEHFSPSVNVEMQDDNGEDVLETMRFKNLGDFNADKLKENSDFLSKLDVEKEQNIKIARQLSSNKALLKALANPETRQAILDLLQSSLDEVNNADAK